MMGSDVEDGREDHIVERHQLDLCHDKPNLEIGPTSIHQTLKNHL